MIYSQVTILVSSYIECGKVNRATILVSSVWLSRRSLAVSERCAQWFPSAAEAAIPYIYYLLCWHVVISGAQ